MDLVMTFRVTELRTTDLTSVHRTYRWDNDINLCWEWTFQNGWDCLCHQSSVLSLTGITKIVFRILFCKHMVRTESNRKMILHRYLRNVVVVQLLRGVQPFATPCAAAHQASLFTVSWSLLILMSTESMMPSNYLILCHPLLLPSSIFPSIRVFSSELALQFRYWTFSISLSNEYLGLISFRINWFDLSAIQGTLQSFL